MRKMQYPARVWQDPAGHDWVVEFPGLEGAITGGATREDAEVEAADCLASWLSFAIAEHKHIPNPGTGEHMVAVPLWIAPKVALYCAMQDQKISNSELARRLGVRETVVRRMLDPDHATKAAKIEAALRAVGQRLLVEIKAA